MSELVTKINKEFKIKVNGRNYVGPSISRLVGYEGLLKILANKDLTEKICREALESADDVFVRKLRRGLTIKFYSH